MTGPVPSELMWHSFYAVINALPKVWPFRHLILDDFLHPALYRALTTEDYSGDLVQRNQPGGISEVSETRRFVLKINGQDDLAALSAPCLARLWGTLTEPRFVELLTQKFADDIARRHGPARVATTCAFEMIEDRTGYALKPHTDTRNKLVTVLIYLAEPGADEALGTSLYTIENPKGLPARFADNARFTRDVMGLVRTVPYRPNTALIFAPGDNSFHGVEAVAAGTSRRLIQFQVNRDTAA